MNKTKSPSSERTVGLFVNRRDATVTRGLWLTKGMSLAKQQWHEDSINTGEWVGRIKQITMNKITSIVYGLNVKDLTSLSIKGPIDGQPFRQTVLSAVATNETKCWQPISNLRKKSRLDQDFYPGLHL